MAGRSFSFSNPAHVTHGVSGSEPLFSPAQRWRLPGTGLELVLPVLRQQKNKDPVLSGAGPQQALEPLLENGQERTFAYIIWSIHTGRRQEVRADVGGATGPVLMQCRSR